MSNIKEARELLEKPLGCKPEDAPNPDEIIAALEYKIDQAIAKLKEQPNCEGCEHFKHTNKFHHCWRYTEETSLCKLRQEPIEQPPAGDFTKKVRKDWDENIFGGVIYNLCDRLDRSEAGERILEERIEKLSDTLDRSEASRKDLLTACRQAFNESRNPNVEKILKATIAKAKEVKK